MKVAGAVFQTSDLMWCAAGAFLGAKVVGGELRLERLGDWCFDEVRPHRLRLRRRRALVVRLSNAINGWPIERKD